MPVAWASPSPRCPTRQRALRIASAAVCSTVRRDNTGLTHFGFGLADRAVLIYAEAEDIEHVALETARHPRGLVRLAVPMSFGMCWAPIRPNFSRGKVEVLSSLLIGARQNLTKGHLHGERYLCFLDRSAQSGPPK